MLRLSSVRSALRAGHSQQLAAIRMLTSAAPKNPNAYTADGRRRVTVAYGDGIGPEIMEATLRVLDAVRPSLQFLLISSYQLQRV